MSSENKLLNYFNVNNHQELLDYLNDNPEDPRCKELNEILHDTGEKDEENNEFV